MLKSDPILSELRRRGCKNCEEFIGFVQQLTDGSASNAAIIPQQFQPELRLIGFLEQDSFHPGSATGFCSRQ
jgi:hypothetical protein